MALKIIKEYDDFFETNNSLAPTIAKKGLSEDAIKRIRASISGMSTVELPPLESEPAPKPKQSKPVAEPESGIGLQTTQRPDPIQPETSEFQKIQRRISAAGRPRGLMGYGATPEEQKIMEAKPEYQAPQPTGVEPSTLGIRAPSDKLQQDYDAVQQHQQEMSQWREQALQTLPGQEQEVHRLYQHSLKFQERKAKVLEESFKQIQAEQDAIKEMRVDPSRYFGGEKEVTRQLTGISSLWAPGKATLAVLGAMATAFGASLTGGDPMAGVKLTQQLIDRDVQQQVDAINRRRQGVADMKSALKMKMDLFNNEQAAIQMHKADMMDLMNMELGKRDRHNKLAMQRAQLKMQSEQLRMQAKGMEMKHAVEMERLYRQGQVDHLKRMSKTPTGTLLNNIAEIKGALKNIESMRGQWDKMGPLAPLQAATPVVSSDAKKMSTMLQFMLATNTKAFFGGHASETDREVMRSTNPSLWDSNKRGHMQFDAQASIGFNKAMQIVQILKSTPGYELAGARLEQELLRDFGQYAAEDIEGAVTLD